MATARASFEQVVRRGIARGELPADLDIGLFIDVVRAPFIYRRVVAQTTGPTGGHRARRRPRARRLQPSTQLRGRTSCLQHVTRRTGRPSGGLHGIGDSLYTPFSGTDGDDIDYDAYRALVRYCVGDLGHAMLWLTSGIAEWWSLTIDERKRLLEVAVEEARAIAPDTVIQACTSAASAKDCLELTQHAEAHGADICYLQTPPMEVHAGEGVQRFFQYVADRTDIALGMFNSPSSGYALSAGGGGADRQRDPRGVRDQGRRDAALAQQGVRTRWLPSSSSGSATSSCTGRAGCSRASSGPAQLGTAGYLYETPDKPMLTDYWKLIWEGRLAEAIAYAQESGLDQISEEVGGWFTRYPGRPDYFTPLGRGVPVRRRGDRPAGRRLPALAPAAGHPARGGQGADPRHVRECRAGQPAAERVAPTPGPPVGALLYRLVTRYRSGVTLGGTVRVSPKPWRRPSSRSSP